MSEANSAMREVRTPRAARRRAGRLRRLRRRPRWRELEVRTLGAAVWLLLRLLRATTRFEVAGVDAIARRWSARAPSVLAFWHGRSIMVPFFYAGPGATIMNSRHRDGEIITRALERFGIASTRGSSSRGAVSGSLGLVRALRKGGDVALIPDGPRGPAGVAKAGAILLAEVGGAPLFPIAFSARPCVRLRTWDRMMVPLPGARVVCVVGEPLTIGRSADKADRETARAELERRLSEVTREADRLVGRPQEDT